MFSRSVSKFRVRTAVAGIAACVIFGAVSLLAQGEQIIKGVVTASKCAALGSHATMIQPGEDNAQCAIDCVKKGSKWVLIDSDDGATYQLDKQKKFKVFAGRFVAITGSLDKGEGVVHVDSVVAAVSQQIFDAKSVYIFCDACPRGMAKAKDAAIEEVEIWNRFNVVSDPMNADLVFIFSANPYLGDYTTRDGPDPRPVHIDTTFMNVVDPKTGANLWGGFEQWGSVMVARATRALIDQLKLQMEEQQTKGNLPAALLKGRH
jgi:hypothetical protein